MDAHEELVAFAAHCLHGIRREVMIEAEDLVLDLESDVLAGRLRAPQLKVAWVAWYKGVIRNRARHVAREAARLALLDDRSAPIAVASDEANVAEKAEISDAVDAALRTLGERRRQIVELHWGEQVTAEEISRRLAIKPSTVWTHLYRGARQLRRLLQKHQTVRKVAWASPELNDE
jgi:RNA polymerase sigma factor (sigma-70 family)